MTMMTGAIKADEPEIAAVATGKEAPGLCVIWRIVLRFLANCIASSLQNVGLEFC